MKNIQKEDKALFDAKLNKIDEVRFKKNKFCSSGKLFLFHWN